MIQAIASSRFGALHRVALTELRNYTPKDENAPIPAMNDAVRGNLVQDLITALGGTGVHSNLDFFVGRTNKYDHRDTLYIATGRGDGNLNKADAMVTDVVKETLIPYVGEHHLQDIHSVNAEGHVGQFRIAEGPSPKVIVKDKLSDKPVELIFDTDQSLKTGWFSQIQTFQGAESCFTKKKKAQDKNAE